MDRYEKGVLLGKGTFATVYKATDKQVGLGVRGTSPCTQQEACSSTATPRQWCPTTLLLCPCLKSTMRCRRARLWPSRTSMWEQQERCVWQQRHSSDTSCQHLTISTADSSAAASAAQPTQQDSSRAVECLPPGAYDEPCLHNRAHRYQPTADKLQAAAVLCNCAMHTPQLCHSHQQQDATRIYMSHAAFLHPHPHSHQPPTSPSTTRASM